MINNMENKRVRNKRKSSVILGVFIIICLSITLLRGITVTSIAEDLKGTVYAKDFGTDDYTLIADTVIDVTGLTGPKSINKIYLNGFNLTITGNSEYALRLNRIWGTGNFTLDGGTIKSDDDLHTIEIEGNINILGGNIESATSLYGNDILIRNGNISLTGNDAVISGRSITIEGGNISTICGALVSRQNNISISGGIITLRNSRNSDVACISSLGAVSISGGQLDLGQYVPIEHMQLWRRLE